MSPKKIRAQCLAMLVLWEAHLHMSKGVNQTVVRRMTCRRGKESHHCTFDSHLHTLKQAHTRGVTAVYVWVKIKFRVPTTEIDSKHLTVSIRAHALPALTNNWRRGAPCTHTTAPISVTRPFTPHLVSYCRPIYYAFPVTLRVYEAELA